MCNVGCGGHTFNDVRLEKPLPENKCAFCEVSKACSPRDARGAPRQNQGRYTNQSRENEKVGCISSIKRLLNGNTRNKSGSVCCTLHTCHEPDKGDASYDCRNGFTGGLTHLDGGRKRLDLASGLLEPCSATTEADENGVLHTASVCCPDFTPRQGACALSLDDCLNVGIAGRRTASLRSSHKGRINEHRAGLNLSPM